MSATVSSAASSTWGALSGAGVALATTLGGPANVPMMIGVLGGALVYLLRSREEHRLRRYTYFALSLMLGYYLALWIIQRWPVLPAILVGLGSGALIVIATTAVFDWAVASFPGIASRLGTSATERIDRVIGGDHEQ